MKLKKKYKPGDIIRLSYKIRYATVYGYEGQKAPLPFWGIVEEVSPQSGYSVLRVKGKGGSAWWRHNTVTGYAGNIQDHLKGKLK